MEVSCINIFENVERTVEYFGQYERSLFMIKIDSN